MTSRRTTSFTPKFYPPWVGIPPPNTLSPSQAKHLYDHIRTVAFYLDAITALVPQTRDSPVQVSKRIENVCLFSVFNYL